MFLYTMESANLICGDQDSGEAQPGASTYLALRTVKLPNLEENYVEHVPGGGVAAVEIYTHMNRLECAFTLAGWQPRVQGLLGRASISRQAQRYTVYGVVREQKSGRPMKAIAQMWGRLGQANPTAFRRGDLFEHEFAIKGITRYYLQMQEDPAAAQMTDIYFWDFYENRLVVDGVDVYNQENAILGIATQYTFDMATGAY